MVDKSEKFRWLVRLGFAARGVVYLLLGYLFLAATGQSRASRGASGVAHLVLAFTAFQFARGNQQSGEDTGRGCFLPEG